MFKLLPKFGPFRPLAFKAPTPETEHLFLESLDRTRDDFRASLSASRQDALRLPNKNLDTGANTALGEYSLADRTYEQLLEKLADRKFVGVPPALARNIAAYFGDAQSASGRHLTPSQAVAQGQGALTPEPCEAVGRAFQAEISPAD